MLINEHILLSNMLLVRQLFGTSLYPLCVFASCALSKRTAYHRYVKFATRFVCVLFTIRCIPVVSVTELAVPVVQFHRLK